MAKREKPKTRKVKIRADVEQVYYDALNRVLDEVARSYPYTNADLSRDSGLSYGTISKLMNGVTRWPQYRTVVLVCRAAGIEIVLSGAIKEKKAKLAAASG